MKLFNSIQIVSLLTASPILLNLLANATFPWASSLFWLGILIATILFGWVVGLVHDGIGN